MDLKYTGHCCEGFWSRIGNCVHNCQLMKEDLANFNGLSQEGGRANFAKNLRASPFKKDLSNGIIFRQIHLHEQYH
jgi:hypothetical protein